MKRREPRDQRFARFRWLRAGLVVAIIVGSAGVVHLFHVANQTRSLCDDFVARRLPAPVPPCHQAFTFFLNAYPTGGEWPGLKPGWVLTYGNAGPGSGLVFYVDLAGNVVHSEPLGWKEELARWTRAGKPSVEFGVFMIMSNMLASLPAVEITKGWHNLDANFEEFVFEIKVAGPPVRLSFNEDDPIFELSREAGLAALRKRINRELGLPPE